MMSLLLLWSRVTQRSPVWVSQSQSTHIPTNKRMSVISHWDLFLWLLHSNSWLSQGPYWSHTDLLTDLCPVPAGQDFQIWEKGTGFYHSLIIPFLQLTSKKDVFPERMILNPGLLGDVGHWALESKRRRKQGKETQTWLTRQQPAHPCARKAWLHKWLSSYPLSQQERNWVPKDNGCQRWDQSPHCSVSGLQELKPSPGRL